MGRVNSMGTFCIPSHAPLEDHPVATHREPSALYCWILEILWCNPKGRRALLRLRSGEVFAFVGLSQNRKDLKVDVGTTWSNPNRLATPLIRISFSSPPGGEVGVGLMRV